MLRCSQLEPLAHDPSMRFDLEWAFLWDATPEGEEFWTNVDSDVNMPYITESLAIEIIEFTKTGIYIELLREIGSQPSGSHQQIPILSKKMV